MTEDEARQKWCPFVRTAWAYEDVRNGIFVTANRGNTDDACRCIASECMAFRWADEAVRELGNGMVAIVDKQDWDLLAGCWWDGRYPKRETGYLHRAIVERVFGFIPNGMFVDHIDGDGLNNRRGNLRLVTPQQNAANAATRGGKSKYRGVYQQKNGRWSAQISSGGVRACLGTYDTQEEAAAAYDKAAQEIHGDFARLNLVRKTNSGRQGYCGLAGKP